MTIRTIDTVRSDLAASDARLGSIHADLQRIRQGTIGHSQRVDALLTELRIHDRLETELWDMERGASVRQVGLPDGRTRSALDIRSSFAAMAAELRSRARATRAIRRELDDASRQVAPRA
jgi:hypothetical protein